MSLRRALYLGHVQAALWSMGNGLTSGAMITYLAMDLGAKGLDLSLILALPAVVGLLRLGSPPIIRVLGGTKPACLALYLPSYVLLAGLPIVVIDGLFPDQARLPMLIALLCANNLLEYVGHVAFWTWMGDLIPRRIRGRYLGRRQVWQIVVLIPTVWAGGQFADFWKNSDFAPSAHALLGYAIPIGGGALLLFASLVPLAMIPPTTKASGERKPPDPSPRIPTPFNLQSLVRPFTDRRFLPLIVFYAWFSIANGLTQAAQGQYPKEVLALPLHYTLLMVMLMRVGQVPVAHWAGTFSDRHGNRPVLLLCQLLVSLGPLFFLLATPAHPWVLVGAWLAFTAFAGHNVCLNNLMLKLSPPESKSSYLAAYFAANALAYAAATVAGGVLLDFTASHWPAWHIGSHRVSHYDALFTTGTLLRLIGVALLLWIAEPAVHRWREILRRPDD